MCRLFALAAAFMLAFACLADVAHAASGTEDGCPQARLESQRASVSADSVILPDRVEPDEPTALAGVVPADGAVRGPIVVGRPFAPRAPPLA
jgi:hypothetical protein